MLGSALVLISLAVALTSIFAETKNRDAKFPKSVRPAGWILAGLACATATFTLMEAANSDAGKRIREYEALHSVERGLYTLFVPYIVQDSDEPPGTADRFKVADRFGDRIEAICDVPLGAAAPRYFQGSNLDGKLWGDLITTEVSAGSAQLATVQATNQDVLSDEVNRGIAALSLHPWTEFLLQAKGLEERRRSTAGRDQRPLCATNLRSGYAAMAKDYRQAFRNLEEAVGRRICELRDAAHQVDDIPPFFRGLEGGYFIPPRFLKRAAADDPQSKDLCQ